MSRRIGAERTPEEIAAAKQELLRLGVYARGYAALAEFALAVLPSIEIGEGKCCGVHCGACETLLTLHDGNLLNAILGADGDCDTFIWWVGDGVDPVYLAARISRECNCDD